MHVVPCLLVSLIVCAPPAAFAATAEAESAPWDAALNFEFNEASDRFAERHVAAPDDARVTLAHAATLLARQPRTQANVNTARALVERVLAAPGGSVAPDHHALALYLRTRIIHEHEARPDLAAARAGYEELRRLYPAHPLADHAAVHLAILLLHQTPGIDFEARRAGLEALVETAHAPSARRELLYLLGRLHWDERADAAAALSPLIAARELGYEAPARNGEVDLFIADLAARAGRPELSARHFLAFVHAYPRDTRTGTAKRLAAEQSALAANPAASAR
ncbi:MAG: hypothetical protein MUE42_13710 [Opitutaceae bacterium]|jgi:hypothetical protein|nr:hypothetical protein [Opitutaceae bacterium]